MCSPLFPLLPFSVSSNNDDIIMSKIGPPWVYRGESAPLILMRFLRTYLLNITEKDLNWFKVYIQQHFLFPREISRCLVFLLEKLVFSRQNVIFCRFGRTSQFGCLCYKNNYVDTALTTLALV